ncbi:hypothetical protein AB0N88_35115 [Streptomyces sp. NPDC093516]|uniref:hypothetical protein n=1 Tax=Streptomyces sp. NPDC093516 TaxID=3155304 RepID=UPI00341EA2C7
MPAATVAALGAFDVVGGLGPPARLRSFAWVFGPQADEWLQTTPDEPPAGAGRTQLAAVADPARERRVAPGRPEGPRHARRSGPVTAATLPADDLVCVPRGRQGTPSTFSGSAADAGERAGGRPES